VSQPIAEGSALAARLRSQITARAGNTVIPLNVVDDDVMKRLEGAAKDFHVSGGGLVITDAWVFEELNLYSEKVLIEKETLEWLVRFFNVMTDTALDAKALRESMANLLGTLAGENLRGSVDLQELLEKRLGIHFTTNLLSIELDYLSSLDPRERLLLQDRIRNATVALADFLDINTNRFRREPRVWMPVTYLP
jgi:hypothetical protein